MAKVRDLVLEAEVLYGPKAIGIGHRAVRP